MSDPKGVLGRVEQGEMRVHASGCQHERTVRVIERIALLVEFFQRLHQIARLLHERACAVVVDAVERAFEISARVGKPSAAGVQHRGRRQGVDRGLLGGRTRRERRENRVGLFERRRDGYRRFQHFRMGRRVHEGVHEFLKTLLLPSHVKARERARRADRRIVRVALECARERLEGFLVASLDRGRESEGHFPVGVAGTEF